MTIKSAMMNLCKCIGRWPFRSKVKDAIHKVVTTSAAREARKETFGELGYLGRRSGLQILGFLLVNSKAESLSNTSVPVEIRQLPQEKLVILEQAHAFISAVANACSTELDKLIPDAGKLINPYSGISYTFAAGSSQLPPESPAHTELAEAFATHPGFASIGRAINAIPDLKRPAHDKLGPKLDSVLRKIGKVGPLAAPDDIGVHEIRFPEDSPQIQIHRYIYSFICLKATLQTIVQLIYQKLQTDKLVAFDNDNVFGLQGPVSHMLGQSLSLSVQPSRDEIFAEAGDIVVVDLKPNNFPIHGLYRTERLRLSFNRELGDRLDVDLRRLDDHLNPYPSLIPPA